MSDLKAFLKSFSLYFFLLLLATGRRTFCCLRASSMCVCVCACVCARQRETERTPIRWTFDKKSIKHSLCEQNFAFWDVCYLSPVRARPLACVCACVRDGQTDNNVQVQ